MKSLEDILGSDDNLNNKEYWKTYKRPQVKFSPQRKNRSLCEVTDELGSMVRSIM